MPPAPSEEELAKNLGKAFRPPGGWPHGDENPFLRNKGFSYDTLTPEQKQNIDKLMGQMNKRNQGFVKQAQLAGGSGLVGGSAAFGDESDGEDSLEDSEDSSLASDKSLIAGFSGGGDSGNRSIDSLSLGDSLPSGLKKKNSLAEQMKKMLKKFQGRGSGFGQDSLAKKSVQVGQDIVGVAEDNIFMMVHRRHRALDDKDHFLKNAF